MSAACVAAMDWPTAAVLCVGALCIAVIVIAMIVTAGRAS